MYLPSVSWGGVDAIPLLPGESRRQAVDRVYAGGTVIEGDRDQMTIGTTPGPERDTTRGGRSQHAWMVQAATILEELRPGWTVVREHHEPGQALAVEPSTGKPGGVNVGAGVADCITFRWVRECYVDDAEWRFWWRTIRRSARLPAALFDPDTYELVVTSLSAAAARERYNWI
jgi:hypothetical protein